MVARLSTFVNDVETVPLTALSLATAAPVVAADTIIVGIGKLQAQVSATPTLATLQRTSLVNALIFG